MFVYLIRDEKTKAVKIGSSKHPEKRLKQLQTGNGSKLRLIHVIKCDRLPVKKVEKHLRNWFRSQREQGEWCRLSQEDIDFLLAIESDTFFLSK